MIRLGTAGPRIVWLQSSYCCSRWFLPSRCCRFSRRDILLFYPSKKLHPGCFFVFDYLFYFPVLCAFVSKLWMWEPAGSSFVFWLEKRNDLQPSRKGIFWFRLMSSALVSRSRALNLCIERLSVYKDSSLRKVPKNSAASWRPSFSASAHSCCPRVV